MDFQLAKREVFIFMIVGPRGHVHDSQNQLFLTLDTPSYFKTAKKLPNTSRYLLKILECDINVFQKIWNGNIGIFKFNWRNVNMCRLFWLPISKTKSVHLHDFLDLVDMSMIPKTNYSLLWIHQAISKQPRKYRIRLVIFWKFWNAISMSFN